MKLIKRELKLKIFENKFISLLNPKQVLKYKNILKLKNITHNTTGKVSVLRDNDEIYEKNIKFIETDTNFIIVKSNNISLGKSYFGY